MDAFTALFTPFAAAAVDTNEVPVAMAREKPPVNGGFNCTIA